MVSGFCQLYSLHISRGHQVFCIVVDVGLNVLLIIVLLVVKFTVLKWDARSR